MPDHILFLPGFKGSRLVDQRGRPVWISTAQAARTGTTRLALPQPYFRNQPAPDLAPGSVLDRVVVVPGMWNVRIYGPFLDWLAHTFPASVIEPFPYDWRRDCRVAGQELLDRVIEIGGQGKRVAIIAHSTGGLVAAAATGSTLFPWSALCGLVTIAVPFRGTAKMFRVALMGDPVGRNQRLLDGLSLSSFESTYQLLSEPDHPLIYRISDLTPIPGAHFDPVRWQQAGWGPWAHRNPDDDEDSMASFVADQLAQARAFRHFRDRFPGNRADSIPLLNVVGTGRPTLDRVFWDDRPGFRNRMVLNAAQRDSTPELVGQSLAADGDGTVTSASARLPDQWAVSLVARNQSSSYEHGNIPNDPDVRRAIRHLLLGQHPEESA